MNKSSMPANDNQLQALYDRTLTTDKKKEMMFNLVNYVELLIEMDGQHRDWLKTQKTEGRNGDFPAKSSENQSKEDIQP